MFVTGCQTNEQMTHQVVISDAKSTTVDHSIQEEILAEYGANTRSVLTRTEDEVLAELEDPDGLIVDAGVPVTRRVLERVPSLRVVGRAGIGVDNVNIEAAADRGVTVVNHPTYCIDEVATHALSLMLSCFRGIPKYDRQTCDGGWDWSEGRPLSRLQGSTLGFIAFGKIPQRIATMVQGFGCDLLAYDPYVSEDVIRTHNVEPVELEELFNCVDILSVHAPLTGETRGMVDADALGKMADNAVLVNTARGPIVDTDALVDALRSDSIGFAGLDVVDPEPLPEHHPLRDFGNAVVTPHTAWYSEDSREQLSRGIAHDVGRVLQGEQPQNPIDPESQWV